MSTPAQARRVFMFTDFGPFGPYIGQMRAALLRTSPGLETVDLVNDAPRFSPLPSAYLLAALADAEPDPGVFLAVVDPGVGTDRRPVVVRTERHVFVGPDNGLFNIIARRNPEAERAEISWRPERLSDSFHGRDLFAPAAARLAAGQLLETRPFPWQAAELAALQTDWPAVIYVDYYGNLVTGLRGGVVARTAVLRAAGCDIAWARTFGAVPSGKAFWYVNSSGLVEIAVHGGRAEEELDLAVGDSLEVANR